MECFQFSGNLKYFGLVYNFDLFLAMYKCVTPLSLDPKRRIPVQEYWCTISSKRLEFQPKVTIMLKYQIEINDNIWLLY